MIKKLLVILFFTSLLLSSTISSGRDSIEKDSIEHDIQNVKESNESTYNPRVYGKFLNNTYNAYRVNPIEGSSKYLKPTSQPIIMDIGEEKKIPIFITCLSSTGPFEREKTINDFDINFILVNKKDWIPEEAELGHIERYDKTDLEIGWKYEDNIKFNDRWFKNLKEKTQEVYDINYPDLKYSQKSIVNRTVKTEHGSRNLTGLSTNITISVNQAGYWSLSTLMKPENGNYWIFAGERGQNITLKVKKPAINKYLPIVVPGIMIGSITVYTYCIKKRKYLFKRLK